MKTRPVTRSEIANAARSPNHTSKSDALAKRLFIEEWGKDTDGAYRVSGRLDGVRFGDRRF